MSEEDRKAIAQILRDNITFSPQVGDYVIHGAIEKIGEYWHSKLKALQGISDGKSLVIKDLESKLKERDELIEEMSHGLTVATKLAEKHLAIGTKEMFQYLLTRYSNLKAK